MTIAILLASVGCYVLLFALPETLGRIVQRTLDTAKRHRPP